MAEEIQQGAQTTEKTENERARLVNPDTGEAIATENSENARAKTVPAEDGVEKDAFVKTIEEKVYAPTEDAKAPDQIKEGETSSRPEAQG